MQLFFRPLQGDAGIDVVAVILAGFVAWPCLADRRMSGSEIAAEEGLAHFNVTIVFGPLFVDRVKDVDIDLLIGTKLTFLADKGCNRRRQIAHLDDRLVGGGDMGEAVVIGAEPLQALGLVIAVTAVIAIL